jgi:hypothetical protein
MCQRPPLHAAGLVFDPANWQFVAKWLRKLTWLPGVQPVHPQIYLKECFYVDPNFSLPYPSRA